MNGGSGHCLCGSVAYAFEGAPNWQAHCHCESCRRNCSAPYTSYLGVSHGKWRWTGQEPVIYHSSPGVRRHFCATCGTQMAFEGERWAHEIHFYAASLDDPSSYRPTAHVNYNEHLSWVDPGDGLKRFYTPRRLGPADDLGPALGLIRQAFAGMTGRIDPPSSAERLDLAALGEAAAHSELWVIEDLGQPIACVILTPRPDRLYIGKLAVADTRRRQGLARQLISHARKRAEALGLGLLELQTRVELVENHAAFQVLGFVETARSAHEGYDKATTITFCREV